MGAPLNEYNIKLIERIHEIKDADRLSNEKLAEFMDCGVDRVSRILKYKAKPTCEEIAMLSENLPADPDYLMYGKRTVVARLAQYWVGASENELAELHLEMARKFKRRASIMHSKKQSPDFVTDNDTIIETID